MLRRQKLKAAPLGIILILKAQIKVVLQHCQAECTSMEHTEIWEYKLGGGALIFILTQNTDLSDQVTLCTPTDLNLSTQVIMPT